MALSLVQAANAEPIALADARRHLRVPAEQVDEDSLINALIAAARSRAETVTGRQLTQATWDLNLDRTPDCYEIHIPKPPLITVDSVKYIDPAGVQQTWDPSFYQVEAPAGPHATFGRLQPAYGQNWPATRSDTLNALSIRFKAGYGTSGAAVPTAIRQALLLMIGAWFYGREDDAQGDLVPPLGALALLTPFKVFA